MPTRPLLKRLVVCWVLAAAEGGVLGIWSHAAIGFRWQVGSSTAAVVVAVLFASLTVFGWFRRLLRVIGVLHALVAVLAVRVFLESLSDADTVEWAFASYVFLNMTLPALVSALLPVELVDREKPELPPGYDYLDPSRHRLSNLERLVLILGVSLAIPFFMMGGIFLSIIWLPLAFVVYWLARMLRTRKPGVATVGRHVRLATRRETTAQSQSYWTVNADPFRDDADDPERHIRR